MLPLKKIRNENKQFLFLENFTQKFSLFCAVVLEMPRMKTIIIFAGSTYSPLYVYSKKLRTYGKKWNELRSYFFGVKKWIFFFSWFNLLLKKESCIYVASLERARNHHQSEMRCAWKFYVKHIESKEKDGYIDYGFIFSSDLHHAYILSSKDGACKWDGK